MTRRRLTYALLLLVWLGWKLRLLPPDKRFWGFVWAKFIYETVSGYGPGELDHWPEAERYGRSYGDREIDCWPESQRPARQQPS